MATGSATWLAPAGTTTVCPARASSSTATTRSGTSPSWTTEPACSSRAPSTGRPSRNVPWLERGVLEQRHAVGQAARARAGARRSGRSG